jgi:uncharacterized membrane protein (DUF106 family)
MLPEYIQRMQQEAAELQAKIDKLDEFLNTSKVLELRKYEVELLDRQLSLMLRYLQVLAARIGFAIAKEAHDAN